jgi:hypothetical protein
MNIIAILEASFVLANLESIQAQILPLMFEAIIASRSITGKVT